jgi:MFS family permease
MNKSYQYMVFAICWFIGISAGIYATIFSIMLSQAIGDLSDQSGITEISQYGSYIIASFLFGWMLGGILLGIMSDKFGRVKALAISIAILSLFSAAAGMSQTVWQLALLRFFVGVGVGGAMLGCSIFLSETWPSRSRAVALGAMIASYQVGVLLSALIAQLLPNWRLAFSSSILALIIVLFVVFVFRETHAAKQSKEIDQGNNKKNMFFGGIIFGCLLIGYWATSVWVPTWLQELLGNNALGHEKNVATMIQGFCAIGGCVLAGPSADSLGRKPSIMISFLGAFAISWLMFWQSSFSVGIYVMNGALGFFIGMTQAVMYIYLPELFPANIRATAVGICLNGGRLFTTIAVLFVGAIVALLGGYAEALCLFSLTYLLGALTAYFAPDTAAKKVII